MLLNNLNKNFNTLYCANTVLTKTLDLQPHTYHQPSRLVIHQPYQKTHPLLHKNRTTLHILIQIQLQHLCIRHTFRMLRLQVIQNPITNPPPQTPPHWQDRTQIRPFWTQCLVRPHQIETVFLLATIRFISALKVVNRGLGDKKSCYLQGNWWFSAKIS